MGIQLGDRQIPRFRGWRQKWRHPLKVTQITLEVVLVQVTVLSPQGRRIPRGQIVVEDGGRIWETRVRESRHLYRARDAWTISETILAQLRDLGVGRIRFVVVDRGGEICEVSLSEFLKLAEPLDQSGWKRKTEKQLALPRRFWDRRESAQAQRQLALQL